MHGRTLAVWYRLKDPDEARRHVPLDLQMDDDPVVRARFWDLEHDGLSARDPGGPPVWSRIQEAVVAFPVEHPPVRGDYPIHMYADEFSYTAFGREVMGWPIRDGLINVDPEPVTGPTPGARIEAVMARGGIELMRVSVTLGAAPRRMHDEAPPRWLAHKSIPDASRPVVALAQLVETGPERIHHRTVWPASATLEFGTGPGDELHLLAPREIVRAEYWTDVDLTIGWATILDDTTDRPDSSW